MHILFVCTGNTCRSPMAEGLLREALAARGIDHVTVASAGTGASRVNAGTKQCVSASPARNSASPVSFSPNGKTNTDPP